MRRAVTRGGESGVSAPLGAAVLLALFGAATLTVDAGNAWQNRRNLVTATDSAALREAELLALDPSSACKGEWDAMMDVNAGTDWYTEAGEGCLVHEWGETGYVTVDAHQPSSSYFSGVLGIGDGAVYSMSGAMWGYVSGVNGLRPMGVCLDNHHIREWLDYRSGAMSEEAYLALRGSSPDHPTPVGSTGVVHRISFTKDSPNACGADAPGNWGWQDLNGGSNSNSETQAWVVNGYPGTSEVGDCYADDTNQPCPGDTGSSGGSPAQELNSLLSRGTFFHIPIYDLVTGTGSNVRFRIAGFLGVRLWGYRINGSEASRHFTYEFHDLIADGPCCGATQVGVNPVKGVALCAVDHDSQALSSRCDVTP